VRSSSTSQVVVPACLTGDEKSRRPVGSAARLL